MFDEDENRNSKHGREEEESIYKNDDSYHWGWLGVRFLVFTLTLTLT